jgi:uncharacterized membrane protein YgcG
VQLHRDRSLDVNEVIVYNFGSEIKHGILRFIPIKYERQQRTYEIGLRVTSITDEHATSLPYQLSEAGSDLQIRIGDAQSTVTGIQTYKIRYTVKRAVNFFHGEPEVYWNATGNGWPVAIDRATARFLPPAGVTNDQLKIAGFYGPEGATYKAFSKAENGIAHFQALNLKSGDGLTFVVRLPQGSVEPLPWSEVLAAFLLSWWPALTISLAAFISMLSLYLSRGRDVDRGQAISVEWHPPKDLSPAQVGALIDEKCDMRDMISILFDLTVRGYIEIHEFADDDAQTDQEDIAFVQTYPQPDNDPLKPHEQMFFDRLFVNARFKKSNFKARKSIVENRLKTTPPISAVDGGPLPVEELAARVKIVRLSELKGQFHPNIFSISHRIFKEMISQQIFFSNPEETRTIYLLTSIALAVLGGVLFPFAHSAWSYGFLSAGAIVAAFHKAMPAKTAKGSRYLQQCKSFARFVELVEKPRLAQMYDEDPNIFGRLLPYAIVLGVADKWAEGFQDLLTTPPPGFFTLESTRQHSFDASRFIRDIDNNAKTISKTFQIPPKEHPKKNESKGSYSSSDSSRITSAAGSGSSGFSSGGGHSGGGFGGGGGKSW